ncbi:MAG: hypothetical protein Q9O62_10310 [Ardenticatenia bacterium]|nr:hypothetical protein [Ardenticatenia bacterium]
MVTHKQGQLQKQRFEEAIEIIRALLVERRYSHATRKARELVQNQEAPKDVRHRARWYLLLASLGAQLKENPCFHDQWWLDLRRSVDEHSSTPDQLAHHFQPLWNRWHACLRHSEAARALHTILEAHRQVLHHRQVLQQALLTATDHSAAPWLERAQAYVDALQRCLNDLEPLRQKLDRWRQHDYVFPDDPPFAFSQELSQKLQATSQAIEQLQKLEELARQLHQAAQEASQLHDALHALEQQLLALLHPSTTDASLLPQLNDWLQRYRQAFHALEQAATRAQELAQELDRAHHALHQAPPPVSSWAREVLSPSPSPHIPSPHDLRPRRHLLDLLDRLHQKIQTADFHAVSEEVDQYPHPLPQSAPLQHLLDWHRNAARHGLRFLYRFEGELDRAEKALDAWNLQDAHRQLQQLQQLLTQPPWPLPTHLLERLDKLRTRFQHQHHLERSVQESLDHGHYLAVLTRLASPQGDRQHAWHQEAQKQQTFFHLVDHIKHGLTQVHSSTTDQAHHLAAQTNQLVTQAHDLPRPAIRRALEALLDHHWTHWLHHNDSFEALQAAVHTLDLPQTFATHAFAHALTSARREVDELAKIEAALSEVKEADWLTWTQWQAQLHRLEQHAQCAASRTQARVVRQRLDQAVQHALRQHALQIQRLLQEEQPQKAYELASSVWSQDRPRRDRPAPLPPTAPTSRAPRLVPGGVTQAIQRPQGPP